MKAEVTLVGIRLEPENALENELLNKWDKMQIHWNSGTHCCYPHSFPFETHGKAVVLPFISFEEEIR